MASSVPELAFSSLACSEAPAATAIATTLGGCVALSFLWSVGAAAQQSI